MAKKQYFAIVDVETTIKDHVADFGIVICDRAGKIYAQTGVLVSGIFGVESLFYDRKSSGIWSSQSVARRTVAYENMLESGSRILASTGAINRWMAKAQGLYNPTLTAYNLAFDESRCQKTGIDLTGFSDRFCLWGASVGNICNTKLYRQFVLDNHLFNTPTAKRNMTFSTTAETVTGFLRGELTDEPHTSIEDIIGYELPTLVHVLKKRDWKEKITPYNWRHFQVKNTYKVK